MKILFIAIAGILLSSCAHNGKIQHPSETIYRAELGKIKTQSGDADFLGLRMSFTDTPAYKPYGGSEHVLTKPVLDALGHARYETCLTAASKLLAVNYTSLHGHYAAMVCNSQLGHEEKGRYHRYVLKGLMESIGNSGDGRSPESSYITISTSELRAFIQLIGLEVSSQTLVKKDGKSFDVMRVVNPQTEDEFDLTFDISIQMTKGLKGVE
jgi:hypothetical protein